MNKIVSLFESVLLKFLALIVFLLFSFCSSKKTEETKKEAVPVQTQPAKSAGAISIIGSEEQFKNIVDTSGSRLLIFDLYADWCIPCKILSPLMEEIAKENSGKASFYKVDIEKHRGIASMFNVMGIPYVIFIKNKKMVHSLTGISPKEKYLEAINTFYQ